MLSGSAEWCWPLQPEGVHLRYGISACWLTVTACLIGVRLHGMMLSGGCTGFLLLFMSSIALQQATCPCQVNKLSDPFLPVEARSFLYDHFVRDLPGSFDVWIGSTLLCNAALHHKCLHEQRCWQTISGATCSDPACWLDDLHHSAYQHVCCPAIQRTCVIRVTCRLPTTAWLEIGELNKPFLS